MAKMIQLRNVPDALHRTLKARAALAGMSLSDFLVREIRKSAERPTAGRAERTPRRSKRGPHADVSLRRTASGAQPS